MSCRLGLQLRGVSGWQDCGWALGAPGRRLGLKLRELREQLVRRLKVALV